MHPLHPKHVTVPVTGQTSFYSSMMQPWAEQHCFDDSIEGYCLDAPLSVPTGEVRAVFKGQRVNGRRMAQALGDTRPGTYAGD